MRTTPKTTYSALLLAIFILQSNGFAQVKSEYFVFLVTGKPTQGTAPDEIQKMQSAHLDNFRRLAKIDELTAAGPCVDPEKNIRGIVAIRANSLKDAESKFGQDPYVSEGFMKTEIHQQQTISGKLQVPSDGSKLEQNTIVILSQGENWNVDQAKSPAVQSKLLALAKAQQAAGKLGFAASFGEQSNNKAKRVAVMIFRGSDTEAIQKLFGDHELLKDKTLSAQVFAQYLAAGTMPSE